MIDFLICCDLWVDEYQYMIVISYGNNINLVHCERTDYYWLMLAMK